MANIFAILTAIALAAGAFFAFKNQEAYKDEIADRQSTEQKLSRTQRRHDKAVADRNATIDDRKDLEAATEGLREQQEAQQAKNTALQSDIDSKKSKSESQASKIDDLERQTSEIGPIEELAKQITKLREDIVGLEDEKKLAEALRSNLTSEKAGTDEAKQRYNEESRKITSKVSFGSASITAIYGPWGFVTLSAGSNGGIVSGSKLDVVRDGEPVAQLQVRSVETGRASADIVPDSVGEDVVLMVGDKVVPTAAK